MKINQIIAEITDQYLKDDRPWIIGFSGGKDSTILLQLTVYALQKIAPELRKKEVHVVCNDTLVENPKIVQWIDKNLQAIKRMADKYNLPIIVGETKPELDDSFWVNLIGKGYPAPNSSFRWCTERLKINPTTKYIKEQVAAKGEVIILLGTRKDESSTRKRSMNKHEIKNQRLRRHIELNLAYVYTPISEMTTNEVWEYLMQVPNPWNGSNRDLVTLYKNGSGGDCPLVIDKSTPSCGQSRFGCWVCTVVKRDKSLEALIENGEEHLEPLLDLRDWLVDNRDNIKYRLGRLRNGGEGKGPYNIDTREYLLERLLKAQKASNEKLITLQELKAIQVIWQMDGYNKNVFDTYYNVYKELKSEIMSKKDTIKKQQRIQLRDFCREFQVDENNMESLVRSEKDKKLLKKRKDIMKIIDAVIEKETLTK